MSAPTWTVNAERPHPKVTLFDVQIGDYHEFFFVAEGRTTISITMLDTSENAHPEPQDFSFAKPHDWRDHLTDEEALLQVWQVVGVGR
jgi:hypothetical protein